MTGWIQKAISLNHSRPRMKPLNALLSRGGGIKMEKMRSTEDAKLVDGTRLKQVFFEKRILKIGNDSGEFIKTFDSVRKAAEDIVREGKASNADVATLVICMVF